MSCRFVYFCDFCLQPMGHMEAPIVVSSWQVDVCPTCAKTVSAQDILDKHLEHRAEALKDGNS